MIAFSILILLMLVVALVFMLPPLLQKGNKLQDDFDRKKINVTLFKDHLSELDNDLANGVLTDNQYNAAKEDLERSLLQDISAEDIEAAEAKTASEDTDVKRGKIAAAAIVILVPLTSIALYAQLGAGERGLDPANAKPEVSAEGHQGSTIEQQVRKLQDYLIENPDDLDKQIMLARSYYFLKQYQPASGAFAKAVELSGDKEPDLLADYADALAMANNRSMAGKPTELVHQALKIQPHHIKALWLAATAAYENKQFDQTLKYYETLRDQFPKGSDNYVQMIKNIGEVKSLMGLSTDSEVAELKSIEANKATMKVSGKVDIDPSLKGQYSPTDTVFIYARATSGPKMPLAIIRTTADKLPMEYALDDSMAMNPSLTLSSQKEVIVSARISKSGSAMPQPGDLQGTSSVVAVGAENIDINIKDKVSGSAAGAPAMGPAAMMAAAGASGGGNAGAGGNGNASVSGTVSLDPTLQSRVKPSDTVFIFAKASAGPRMPLAVLRKQVKDLPITFKLDDSMSMSPQFSLSGFSDVIVGARISSSGDAIPSPGDLQGTTSVIKVGSQGLNIIINSAVP